MALKYQKQLRLFQDSANYDHIIPAIYYAFTVLRISPLRFTPPYPAFLTSTPLLTFFAERLTLR